MTDDSSQALLDHSIRLWQAEEENARRLGRRVNLNLTIIAAVFGIGLLRFLETPLEAVWFSWLIRAFLISGLVLLSVGGLHLLRVFPQRPESRFTEQEPAIASGRLLLDGGEVAELASARPESVRIRLFVKTLGAADYLGRLNDEERSRIDSAQQWMLLGFLSILEAVVGFTVIPTGDPRAGVVVMAVILLLAVVGYLRAR